MHLEGREQVSWLEYCGTVGCASGMTLGSWHGIKPEKAGTFFLKRPYLTARPIPSVPFREERREIWTARIAVPACFTKDGLIPCHSYLTR